MTQQVVVTLASDIVLVTGTVNEQAVPWSRNGDAWSAVADRAADETYRVAITAVNATGVATPFALTLYYGLHLITDRTQADVNRVETLKDRIIRGTATEAEKQEWLAGLKGAYNASDFNRVGAAMQYIAGRLDECGIAAPVTARQDWTMPDFPTQEATAYYLPDVATIRGAISVTEDTPPVPPDLEKLTYTEANDIEQILMDVDGLITNMMQAWYYAGDLYSGEV